MDCSHGCSAAQPVVVSEADSSLLIRRRYAAADEACARYDNHGLRFDRRWRSSLQLRVTPGDAEGEYGVL